MEKRSKLNNEKVRYRGIEFDSQMEADYYRIYLEPLTSQGCKVEFQKEFILQEAFEKNMKKYLPIKYYADYMITYPDGKIKIQDLKGFRTVDFAIKKKLFEKKYAEITLEEIKAVPKYLWMILGQFTLEEKLDKAQKVINRHKKKNGWKVMRAEYMNYSITAEIEAELDGTAVKTKRNRVK